MSFAKFRTGWLGRAGILLSLLVLLAACGGGNTNQGQQTTPTSTTKMVSFNLGIPQTALQSPVVGQLSNSTKMHVVVTFKVNSALLKQLGAQQKNQAGQGTDAASLANQLGITDQQYQQLKEYFGIQNISLNLSKLHTSVSMDAQASAFASLLKTSFVYHQYQGRKFFAPATPVMLPQSIATYIEAISGLDNYSVPPKPQASSFQPVNAQLNKAGCVANENVIFPQDVQHAYGFTQLYKHGWTGQGMTIILPEFNSFDQTSVQHYMSCVGFHGKISTVTVDDTPPTTNDIEPLIDLEMVGSLLPDANIVVYQTDAGPQYENFWSSMLDTLNQISADYSNNKQPVMVSISWGGAEDYVSQDTLNAIDTVTQTLIDAEHISVFASSGDCGAYTSRNYPNQLDVNFPASDPSILAVGGTVLSVNSLGRSKEVVWSGNPQNPSDCENQWGSGGGISGSFAQPDWQQGVQGIRNQYSNGNREVPDVSAVATNLAGYFDGEWGYLYGTSAASPIWACAFALANEALISQTHYYVNGPAIFYWMARNEAKQHPFYDVQQGNNLYYQATPGYDMTSGLGTPNLVGLDNALQAFIHSQN